MHRSIPWLEGNLAARDRLGNGTRCIRHKSGACPFSDKEWRIPGSQETGTRSTIDVADEAASGLSVLRKKGRLSQS